MGTVSHGESIHHEIVGKGSQPLAENRVVAFLPGVEAQVLKQNHFPRRHGADGRLNLRSGDSREAFYRVVQQDSQAVAHRRQPQRIVLLAPGTSQVGAENGPAAAFDQVLDSGQSSPETLIVSGDGLNALLDGHIEVHPHQHPAAVYVKLRQTALGHLYNSPSSRNDCAMIDASSRVHGPPERAPIRQFPKRSHSFRGDTGGHCGGQALVRQLPRLQFRSIAGPGFIQDGHQPGGILRLQHSLHVYGAQLALRGDTAVLQGVNHRQALFPGDNVAGCHCVAALAPEVVDIAGDLPRRSQLDTQGMQ